MTIADSLQEFYKKNNLSKNGGEQDDYFSLSFKLFSLKLPNSEFRKKVVYLHDVQHILYDCDTSWKGEAFIAGWEISTKMWKHLPIGFMSLWAMGFSLLNYPKEVLSGFKAGLNCKGLIDLDIGKKELLQLSLQQVKGLVKRENPGTFNWFLFLFWCFVSELIFFFPLLLLFLFGIYFL